MRAPTGLNFRYRKRLGSSEVGFQAQSDRSTADRHEKLQLDSFAKQSRQQRGQAER